MTGRKYTRRGLAKKAGGVGKKITGKTLCRFFPNLQYVRAVINGGVRVIRVCVRCLKAGKVRKAA